MSHPMRGILAALVLAGALLGLACVPWYEHQAWPLRAGVVFAACAVAAAAAGKTRDDEEDQ